ncbi:FAD-binding monooxygenase [Pseudonocardia yunnanensis]|uniref:FAD-dependent oxidoreductase n=1 Tax=Pseudonocardia yunnanensis TaxID=58107 RepID=A0ABW4EUR6_9PSEU
MSSVSSRRHAIVVGASMGGLCAAKVLSESFERVTVVERDELPAEPTPRRGVPQSRHLHGLLARGGEAYDELFPGIHEELIAAGAMATDTQSDIHWHFDGHLLRPEPSGLVGLAVSRQLLEFTVRARVAALPGVTIIDRCDVAGLTTSPDNRRITGVRIRRRGDGTAESALDADLVVDAAGRATRSPLWLGELGYPRAPEEEVRIQLTYVSQVYRREPHHLDGRIGASYNYYPGQPRGSFILAQEGNRIILTLVGVGVGESEELPTRNAEMAEYAERFGAPEIAEIIRTATPLTEPVLMRYPASIRRHYEQLDRFPDGYLVVADALCSFNPIYGQGMTVAALEALLLSRLMREGDGEVNRRFFLAAATMLDTPWGLVVSSDLRFPEVAGERTEEMSAMDEYLERYREAAVKDAVLGTELLRVANMLDEPARLMAPDLQERVLREAGPVRRASAA